MCQASRPPSWPSGSTEMLSCPVCIEPFGSTVIPVSLPCGHIFCEDDIDQVASIGPFRCPTCRKPFNSGQGQQDIRRLFFSYDAKVGCSGVGDFESYAHPHAARVIYDQLRNLEISSSNNEAESALDNARFWAESLEEIGDESMKKALALLFQSLDHASSRMFDSSKLRIQLKKARSEQSPLRCQLEDALLAVNTANEENVRLSSQLQEAAQNLRWTQLNLRHAESTAISHAERLAVLERSVR
ncbi:hypothetical protein BD410DRAFT_130591 [Rickenella mellea]|uniref:RING-type domain-containing protein n=1 Tax=Rickenella mellea TaxID=50990 RepID=A0A4Y7QA50_9AGAM|nr:hypothetical protein BD410DRAFT_130591 [Rickenella mellea]